MLANIVTILLAISPAFGDPSPQALTIDQLQNAVNQSAHDIKETKDLISQTKKQLRNQFANFERWKAVMYADFHKKLQSVKDLNDLKNMELVKNLVGVNLLVWDKYNLFNVSNKTGKVEFSILEEFDPNNRRKFTGNFVKLRNIELFPGTQKNLNAVIDQLKQIFIGKNEITEVGQYGGILNGRCFGRVTSEDDSYKVWNNLNDYGYANGERREKLRGRWRIYSNEYLTIGKLCVIGGGLRGIIAIY